MDLESRWAGLCFTDPSRVERSAPGGDADATEYRQREREVGRAAVEDAFHHTLCAKHRHSRRLRPDADFLRPFEGCLCGVERKGDLEHAGCFDVYELAGAE